MRHSFRRKWLSLVALVLLVIMIATAGCGASNKGQPAAERQASQSQGITVKVLDIGQGDAILIRTGEQTVLIDSGDVPTRDKLVSYIKKEGISVLDKVIITHPHADHLGGMAAIFDNFTVKEIYDSGQTTTTGIYRQYLAAVQKKKIPFSVLAVGKQVELGNGVVLKILAPDKPFLSGTDADLNNNSIVAKLIFGNFSMLLPGDSEQEAEERMLKTDSGALKSTVLKSAHHGSRTSSSPAFLKAVSAEAVIISAGLNNDYHHPHPSTLKKYSDNKLKVYRTDQQGTITITSDGKNYTISKEKG